MKAIVLTRAGCGECEKEKTLLRAEGYAIEEIDADALFRGDVADVRALVALACNNMAVPVTCINDIWPNEMEN